MLDLGVVFFSKFVIWKHNNLLSEFLSSFVINFVHLSNFPTSYQDIYERQILDFMIFSLTDFKVWDNSQTFNIAILSIHIYINLI